MDIYIYIIVVLIAFVLGVAYRILNKKLKK
jgi:hypothetical protein